MPLFQQKLDVMGFVDVNTHEEQEFNKPYLIILTPANNYNIDENDGYKEYEAVGIRGRRLVFDHFIDQLGNWDLYHSYVLSGNIPLGKEVTLYTFLRLCIEKYFAQSSPITVDDLNGLFFETNNDLDPDKFDLDILFRREVGI